MRKLLFAAILLPSLALAQAVVKPWTPGDDLLCASHRNGTLASGGALCGVRLPPARSFELQSLSIWTIAPAGGGGAGSSVIRFTDGTNNCDFTLACSASSTPSTFRLTGAGACTFPAGASVTATVTTAGCTTTQPTMVNALALGRWR